MATHGNKPPSGQPAPSGERAAAKPAPAAKPAAAEKKSADVAAEKKKPAKRRRQPFRTLLRLMFLLALAAVAAGPWIATHTALLNWVINDVLPLRGTVHVGSADLNWWSPIALRDIELRDPQGQTVLHIDAIIGDRNLALLVLHHYNLGHFNVTHLTANVVLRDGGSNVEDTILLPTKSGGKSTLPAVDVAITDAAITVDDTAARRQYQFEGATAAVHCLVSAEAPFDASFAANLVTAGQTATLKADFHANPQISPGATPFDSGRATCEVNGLPLSIVQPVVRRALASAEVDGQLTTRLECRWGDGDDHQQRALTGQLTIDNLLLSADELGGDRLQVTSIHIPCDLEQTGNNVTFRQLELQSDVGQLKVSGQAPLGDLTRPDLLQALTHETFQLDGRLDLAKLAGLLPKLLRLREGIAITSGELELAVASQPAADGGRWQARLAASNLAALDGGRPVKWQAPLTFTVAAHDGQAGLAIDSLECQSSFLQVRGSGTLGNVQGDLTFDLQRLAAELSQFIDLSGFQLSGAGTGKFAWQRAADQSFSTGGNLTVRDLQVALPGRPVWTEPSLDAVFEATGSLAGLELKQLDKAVVQVNATQERCTAQLTQPVKDILAEPWSVGVNWQGPVANWSGAWRCG